VITSDGKLLIFENFVSDLEDIAEKLGQSAVKVIP
jgi:hypothetical protein